MVFHYLPKNYKSQNFNFQTCLLLQIPIVLCTNSNPVCPFFTYQTIQIMRAYKTHFLCFSLCPNHPSHTQSFTKIDRVTLVFKGFSKFWYQIFHKIMQFQNVYLYLKKIKSPKVKGSKNDQKLVKNGKKNHNYEIQNQLWSP